MADTEVAAAPASTKSSSGSGKGPQLELKKWNAVALWAW
eukprot:CAMPEP_0174229442 /NCGR_PEP_ID=MMETSP0417-20130205/426_1 /TAXON_ID=242541 /ORGANISM="Mayorella sp, Strain BSH-02190019" /LENGTH=38 /DNA_ID= /DNA_START= /DNA_END= /DNA_ORIENTATION=